MNVFNIHRSPVEELKDLYLETKNQEVLNRLLDKCGLSVLLELDVSGMKIFSDCIFFGMQPDVLFSINDGKKLRAFFDYVITRFDEDRDIDDDDFTSAVIKGIEVFNWSSGYVTKSIMKIRNDFLSKLLITEKNTDKSINFSEEIMYAITKNKSISDEWILDELLKSDPRLGVVYLQNLLFRVERFDIFHVVTAIGKVKDALEAIKEYGNENIFDPRLYMRRGLDMFLADSEVQSMIFGLFVSVEKIATQVIYYRKDEFILLLERLTLVLTEYKADVDFYIENACENEGLYPLGDINDEISKESIVGLAYCLYHGSTLLSFQLVKDDRFLMTALKQVADAVGLYIYMELLPENWLDSDEYYNTIKATDNELSVTPVSGEGLDVQSLLDDLL